LLKKKKGRYDLQHPGSCTESCAEFFEYIDGLAWWEGKGKQAPGFLLGREREGVRTGAEHSIWNPILEAKPENKKDTERGTERKTLGAT